MQTDQFDAAQARQSCICQDEGRGGIHHSQMLPCTSSIPKPNSHARKSSGGGDHERVELSTSSARTVAAPRVSTPSFSNISCTCFFTVDSVMPKIVATS